LIHGFLLLDKRGWSMVYKKFSRFLRADSGCMFPLMAVFRLGSWLVERCDMSFESWSMMGPNPITARQYFIRFPTRALAVA
jgi:hypothetical protein